jgi:hypothetical protein
MVLKSQIIVSGFFDLRVEMKHLLDSTELVVASEKVELGRGENLLREKVSYDLDAILATVHVVTQENDIRRGQCRAQAPQNLQHKKEITLPSQKCSETVNVPSGKWNNSPTFSKLSRSWKLP